MHPYSDFDLGGKLIKATIPLVYSNLFVNLHQRQVRLLRSVGTRLLGGPSRLRFIKLEANYQDYWMGDSDAPVSLTYHEALLWFHSRGDRCDNCPSERQLIFSRPDHIPIEMFIRVNK